MITAFNATMSRSTRVLWLLEELGVDFVLAPVTIAPPTGPAAPTRPIPTH